MPRPTSKTAKELSFDKKLNSIVEDRTSGASEIEIKITRLFEEIIGFYKVRYRGPLSKAINRIRKRFYSMANIQNLINFTEGISGRDDSSIVLELINNCKDNIEQNRQLTLEKAAHKIKSYSSIFTLSGSSLVLKSIMEARRLGWKGELKIVESRPGKEGSKLAEKTARAGIGTILAVDMMIPEMIRNSGAVFLGADAITETYFVNKIGSSIAIDYADKFGKPVYILADRSKIISDKIYKFIPDKNPESEIMPRKIRNLGIINNYFEKIAPRGRFHYISGDKILSPGDIKKLLNRRS